MIRARDSPDEASGAFGGSLHGWEVWVVVWDDVEGDGVVVDDDEEEKL